MVLYPNLPGYNVEFKDQGLRTSRPISGPKVTILGVTDKDTVSINDPTLVERREDISNFDHDDGSPSELTKAIHEAFLGGAENVEVVRISDATGLSVNARYDALEDSYDVIFNTNLDVVVPAGAFIDSAGLTGGRNFGYQLADFCYQTSISNNTTIGVIGVAAPTAAAATTGDLSLADLESHVSALEVFDTSSMNGAAFTSYDGVTDDDGDGVPDRYGFVATTDRAVASTPTDADVVTDANGNFVDIGAYISVPATWVRFGGDVATRLYPQLQYYNNNMAAAYAGRITSLNSWSAPTNKLLPGVAPLRELSLSQANRLTAQRFVTAITKPRGFVVTDAMTGAFKIDRYNRSDFVRLTTVRIVHDAVNFIRAQVDPFIGEPNNGVNRNAIEVVVDNALRRMRSLGALEDYEFSLISTPSQRVLGEVTLDLTLVPAFEIRTININVALAPAQR